ncbi:Ribonuclease P protein subunit p30 [Leucoagaricus sp. SymC.cos]|nr:Ribonuclease P protein subunit p30 [Leucoagaricus sp. SymC.cos]
MYFDLNVPISSTSLPQMNNKGKGKQADVFSPAQLEEIESRVDLLVHLGYTVIGFTHTVHKRVEKTHVNVLDSLLPSLRKRDGILYLKRLNIILDEDSEKGFGLINASIPLFDTYDIIALVPTTHTTFSLACLTHSQPSPLTAHIIALPLTLPRLPFHMKHTLVRTAIKNGAVFEINYVGAIGGEHDSVSMRTGVAESGASAKRNWWAASRELVRVTKGKGLILSGGVVSSGDLRAPRDIGNLVTMLGLPQDTAHAMATTNAKSLVLRTQTRRTYRAVFSEPRLVIPDVIPNQTKAEETTSEEPAKEASLKPEKPNSSSKKRVREDSTTRNPDKINTIVNTDSADKPSAARKKRKKNQGRNPRHT